MPETMTKPSYLGLLNAISNAETGAGVYLSAWANATSDPDLKKALQCVAARETSHGEVFCRRIQELGFELRVREDPGAAERVARAGDPNISDLEKVGKEYGDGERQDPFVDMERQLEEGVFDPLTALLMKWYIAEERDSGNILREAYACVREKANGKMTVSMNGHGNGVSADAQAIIACMSDGFARLEKRVKKLEKRR